MVTLKKTYAKVILRTIKQSISRFLAIFAITALGVGFLAGLLSATPDMRHTGDKYFDETNLFDLRIISTLGLTHDDVDFLENYDGVNQVMPAQNVDVFLQTKDGNTLTTRIHGVDIFNFSNENPQNYINRVVLVEGRMPINKNECLVEKGTYGSNPVAVGDVLKVSAENKDVEDTLNQTEFTITGIVQSSYYFSFEREPSTIGNGTTNLVMYADFDAFKQEAYSEIYITLDDAANLNSLSENYNIMRDDMADGLELNSESQRKRRFDEVKTEANETLADAKIEYADKKLEAEQKLADAKKELDDADIKLADGEKEYADGLAELADARQKLIDGEYSYNVKRNEFPAKMEAERAKLSVAKAQYESGLQSLAELQANLDMATQGRIAAEAAYNADPTNPVLKAQFDGALAAEAQLTTMRNDLQVQLSAANAQIISGEAELNNSFYIADRAFAEAAAKLEEGRTEIANGEKDLQEAKTKIEDAKIELADGKIKYEDAKNEADEKLADGAQKIADAEKEINDLEQPEWFVLGRDTNVSFATFDSNISKVEAIATVFPVFFFLVAALVALTTMTRMVEEERLQIGTIKALGYSRKTIAFKYGIYAFVATAAGCVVGLLVGFNLFPRVIWNAYSMMYNLPDLICQFNIKYALISSLTALACTMLATANACWATLGEHPASLMLPRAPKAGKRILLERVNFIWSRMKFTHKVTARNLFRYKKRFFMTVIGIAGCTALLVTGFGLRDSISDVIYKQFGNIFTYDFNASVKDETTLENNEVLELLNNKNAIDSWISVSEEKSTNTFGNETITTYLLVPKSIEEMPKFINLNQRKTKELVPLEKTGVVITEKLAERSGTKIGDEITLTNKDDKVGTFKVTGIAENYVENYVYFSPEEYLRGFGAKAEFTGVLGKLANTDSAKDIAATSLLDNENINTISFISDIKTSFDDMLKNITYVVYVLIVSAAALAFVVLYNLTNINITEREKEIATIKVLGFFDKEVSAYVYRESAMLSLIGTGVGLILGTFLHMFVIRTAEVDAVMFGREISIFSYIISGALTIFFSALVSLVMNIKLKRISMVESMKAPE